MPRYCISTAALETGEFIVHRLENGCSLIPGAAHRIDLGSLLDDDAAIYEAARKFDSIDGCPACMAEYSDHATSDAINAAIAALVTVSNM